MEELKRRLAAIEEKLDEVLDILDEEFGEEEEGEESEDEESESSEEPQF